METDILCSEKKKLFKDINLTASTVASSVDELPAISYQQLTFAAKDF